MKLFLGILFLYLSGYAVDIGNLSAAGWWFIAGIVTIICYTWDNEDPSSFG